MSDRIEAYLGELARAGYGLDSAVVHDILADAEDHLRNAVRDGMSVEAAIEAFGRPEDVVRGYVQAESRGRVVPPPVEAPASPRLQAATAFAGSGAGVATAPPPLEAPVPRGPTVIELPPARKPWLARLPLIGIWFDCHAWGSLLFFILGIAPAIVYFTVLVTGISVGVGSVPIVVGLPLLVLMLGMARAMALFHGQLIEKMTGVRMPRRYAAPPVRPENSFWRRIKLWLTDGRSWLSAALLVGNLPVAAFLFGLFLSLAVVAIVTVAWPIAQMCGASSLVSVGTNQSVDFLFWRLTPDAAGNVRIPDDAAVLALGAGIVMVTLTLYLARAVGWLYAQAAKAIQVTRLPA